MYERIVQLQQKRNITTYRLCKDTGIPQSTVASWKSGKSKPSAAHLKRISETYAVSLLWLMGDDIELEPVELPSEVIKLPVLGRVPAGVPISAITDIEDEPVWYAPPRPGSAEYFALRIKGDSMEPTIHDKSIVIVRRQECCDNGDICIVAINGEDATCKKVHYDSTGVSLISINPEYAPMHYSCKEINDLPVRIVGLVVQVVVNLR